MGRNLKALSLILLMILFPFGMGGILRAEAADAFEMLPTESHHVAELNSDQPYVAGFHVNTLDLEKRERSSATSITVSFGSTNASYFPRDTWLGCGMFVQGQDSKLRNVDYGFYTMLVLDSEGNLYLDLGMHQTREGTAPLQTPSEQLIYAYTWLIQGLNPAEFVTLIAAWDAEGWVHYSLVASGLNITLPAVYVPDMPGCSSVIRKFYCGNVIIGPFPFSRYIHYFQFGVLSSAAIANEHWSVHLKEPRLLRETGWEPVDIAWSIQGDIAYLDYNWMWGGTPYTGASAKHNGNSDQPPNEVIFFHNGKALAPGTVLWNTQATGSPFRAPPSRILSASTPPFALFLVLSLVIFTPLIAGRRRTLNGHED